MAAGTNPFVHVAPTRQHELALLDVSPFVRLSVHAVNSAANLDRNTDLRTIHRTTGGSSQTLAPQRACTGGDGGGGGGGGRAKELVGRVQEPVARRGPGDPGPDLPVRAGLRHRGLRGPHRQGGAGRRLHHQRRGRGPRLRPPARHGERAGNAVRASSRRRAGPHAGRIHAALLDHLPRHVAPPAPDLRVHGPAPAPAAPVPGHCGGVGPVRTLVRAAAVRVRRQLPHPEVLPGAEPGVGHDGRLRGRAGRARAAQLSRRGQVLARETCPGSCSTRRSSCTSSAGGSRRRGSRARRSPASAGSSGSPSRRLSCCGPSVRSLLLLQFFSASSRDVTSIYICSPENLFVCAVWRCGIIQRCSFWWDA
jgi:hypothetical protein